MQSNQRNKSTGQVLAAKSIPAGAAHVSHTDTNLVQDSKSKDPRVKAVSTAESANDDRRADIQPVTLKTNKSLDATVPKTATSTVVKSGKPSKDDK